MRLISTDPSEFGIVGIGQEAHGFLAFGQFAKGVIAVGQIAIGVVAIGQVSLSIAGIGQVGGGVAWFAGMLGFGGRGLCLRLIPGLDVPRTPPVQVPLDDVMRGKTSGYVRLDIVQLPHGPALAAGNQVLPLKLRPGVAWALGNALRTSTVRQVYAELDREGDVVICRGLMEVPGQRSTASLGFNVLRFLLLVGLALLWASLFNEYVVTPALR